MLRAVLASFVFSLSLLLAACGDESPQPAAGQPAAALPASVSGSGNVVKGIIRNGIVSAWRWEAGAYVQVASARTGATGDFVIDIPDPVAGEVLRLQLDVSPDTSPGQRTEMLCDVNQCGAAVRGEWVALEGGLGLTSWASVGADGVVTLMPMTPVSSLVVGHAEALSGGHLTAGALEVARLRVAALFGIAPAQLLSRPGNILDPLWREAASPEALRLSVLSASVAELASLYSVGIDQVIAALVERFNAHDGHLLQSGELGSLADIYQGIASLAVSDPALQEKVGTWLTAAVAGLQPGQLNSSACGEACVPFDSNDVIAAMGTGSDTLGGDLRRVMDEQGAARLEDLLAAQLARYGWLVKSDTFGLAGVVANLVAASARTAASMDAGVIDGVSIVREGNVVHFDGSSAGYAIDLDVTVPPLAEQLYAYTSGSALTFLLGAKGTVQNDRVRARIDGSLTIDATGTDFTAARSALMALAGAMAVGDPVAEANARADLLHAVATIIRTGEASFTAAGEVALARLGLQGDALVETSVLGISGLGQMHVDMDGLAGGGIVAQGHADHGTLTLPSGDSFTIDPAQGHALTFALDAAGTASLRMGAHVLGHAAAVSGSGNMAGLGSLLGHVRDNVAALVDAVAADPAAVPDPVSALLQLLADAKAVALTASGQATIPDYGHTYALTIADGVLTLSQPNSAQAALTLQMMGSGLMASAGGKWWLVGVDLGTLGYPAVTLADSQGGEWRWDFDIAAVLAQL